MREKKNNDYDDSITRTIHFSHKALTWNTMLLIEATISANQSPLSQTVVISKCEPFVLVAEQAEATSKQTHTRTQTGSFKTIRFSDALLIIQHDNTRL